MAAEAVLLSRQAEDARAIAKAIDAAGACQPTLQQLSTLPAAGDAAALTNAAVETIFPSLHPPRVGFNLIPSSHPPSFHFLPRTDFETRTHAWLNGASPLEREQFCWGTIGSGKSYILARMATSLLRTFRVNNAQQYMIYIANCWDMKDDAVGYMKSALMVAYGLDANRLAEIDALPDTWDDMMAWIRRRMRAGDRMYLIIDQFHSLSRSTQCMQYDVDRSAQVDLKIQLRLLCSAIAISHGFVIKASSANNEEWYEIDKEGDRITKLLGGLSEVSAIIPSESPSPHRCHRAMQCIAVPASRVVPFCSQSSLCLFFLFCRSVQSEWTIFVEYFRCKNALPAMTPVEERIVSENTGRLPLYLYALCRAHMAAVTARGSAAAAAAQPAAAGAPTFSEVWPFIHQQHEVQTIYADIKKRMDEQLKTVNINELFEFNAAAVAQTPQATFITPCSCDHRYIYRDIAIGVYRCSSGFAEDAFLSYMIKHEFGGKTLRKWIGLQARLYFGDPNPNASEKGWIVEQLVIISMIQSYRLSQRARGLFLSGITNQQRVDEVHLKPNQYRTLWNQITLGQPAAPGDYHAEQFFITLYHPRRNHFPGIDAVMRVLPHHAEEVASDESHPPLANIRDTLAPFLKTPIPIGSHAILNSLQRWGRAASVGGISTLAEEARPAVIGIQISNAINAVAAHPHAMVEFMSAASRATWSGDMPVDVIDTVQWHIHWILPLSQVPATRMIAHVAVGDTPPFNESYSAIEEYGIVLDTK